MRPSRRITGPTARFAVDVRYVWLQAAEKTHPRARTAMAVEDGLPVVPMDYELLEEQLARDIEDWCKRDIHFKTDGEPAIVAVQSAVAAIRAPARTIPCNPLAFNPQYNGGAEKAC